MKKIYRASNVKTAGFDPVKNFIENPSSGYTLKITEGAKHIRDYALQYRTNMTNVILPSKLKSIGRSAFYNCDSLKELYLPDSVEELGQNAISYCDNLRIIRIGPNMKTIKDGAFSGDNKLIEVLNDSSLSITPGTEEYGSIAYYALEVHPGPSRIKKSGDYSFYSTSSGKNFLIDYTGTSLSITLPSTYNGKQYIINRSCFENSNLNSVVIPSGVTEIGNNAFAYCSALTKATIGSNVTIISDSAFYQTELTSVSIPNKVTTIGNTAFTLCPLTSLTIGSSVKTIGTWAFAYTNLSSLTLPSSLTLIDNYAFYYSDIEELSIGANVTKIGDNAFYGTDVETITYRGTTTQWNKIELGTDWKDSATKYVSCTNGTITL